MLIVMIIVLPSDPDDYDYDYQEVLRIPPRVQGNFIDSSSDSGNSSDGNSDDELYMQEQHIAQNFPDKPMTLVPSPAEYDEDFYNDWTLLENGEDTGHPDGPPSLHRNNGNNSHWNCAYGLL